MMQKHRSLLLLFFTFLSIVISAQRYTYIGGGITLHAATRLNDPNVFHFTTPDLIDGGGYAVTVRQGINNFLSFESGISVFNGVVDYKYNEKNIFRLGLWAHRIPMKVQMEVDLLESKLALYSSFCYLFCIVSSHHRIEGIRSNHEIELTRDYLPESWHFNYYGSGLGIRHNISNDFLFELEFGYVFRFEDLCNYSFTFFEDSKPVSTIDFSDKMDYWYMQFGVSFPFQRITQGARKVKEWVREEGRQ